MPSRNPVHENTFALETADIANPAAGDNIDWACPDNARIQPIYLKYTMICDATVADRFHTLLATTTSMSAPFGASETPQKASETWAVYYVSGYPTEVDLTANNLIVIPMAPDLFLKPGDSLETFVFGIVAGDQLNNINIRYKSWMLV